MISALFYHPSPAVGGKRVSIKYVPHILKHLQDACLCHRQPLTPLGDGRCVAAGTQIGRASSAANRKSFRAAGSDAREPNPPRAALYHSRRARPRVHFCLATHPHHRPTGSCLHQPKITLSPKSSRFLCKSPKTGALLTLDISQNLRYPFRRQCPKE